MPDRHDICPAAEIQPGERRIVEIDGISVGVFNVDGEFYALNNVCPHQLADLCKGPVTGTTTSSGVGEFGEWTRDGEIIRCPWHGWEFEIESGESLFNPHVRTRTFETDVERTDTADAAGDASAPDDEDESSDPTAQEREYGTNLAGDEPPVDTYDVEVEQETVVVYL
jgi:nitrite reductase/ring-hydroxylating ferredoxin subunit